MLHPVFLAALLLAAVTPLAAQDRPPQPRPLEPRTRSVAGDPPLTRLGALALAFKPERWAEGESEHFILHYRRITEAKRVALEIEYHLWYVARALAAGPERYARKSHVFIFEDEKEWAAFRDQSGIPSWTGSAAIGDELFLNLRDGRTGIFDSRTLAHETTHAVVARLYPGQRWPGWLGEGFAEVMSQRSVGARLGQFPGRNPLAARLPELGLAALLQAEAYPQSPIEAARYYFSAERLVRFLLEKHPPERFPGFVGALLASGDFATAIVGTHPDRYPAFAAFEAAFGRYRQ